MADITMCTSNNCPMRASCYRIKAKADEYAQSWSNFEYTCNENSGYPDYISIVKQPNKNIIKNNH